MAMISACVIPVLIVMIGGGLDIASVNGDHERLRNIAQGAALAGASDLSLAASGSMATSRSEAWARAELADKVANISASVSSSIVTLERGARGVRVAIHANRPSIFGRILPPGGWNIDVDAVAAPLSGMPLCVLATQSDKSKIINIRDRGLIRAPACLIHSNRDVVVDNNAGIEAGMVEAGTSIRGRVNPAGVPDAPAIEDPFADLDLHPPTCTTIDDVEYTTGTHTLSPGVHCARIRLRGDALLRFAPGEHWFADGDLDMRDDARLEGDNVVLLFDRESKFDFHDRAMVRLTGRESGIFSGFVLVAVRDNDKDFTISAEHVESLLGVIYIPNARLVVQGRAEIARESAWTVVVAKSIQLEGNPTLFVNANYRGSDVPVPDGVGPGTQGTRLVQ